MKQSAAFRASYSDLKLIKTRQVVQIVFELPLADFDVAYDVLGGMPNPANETWFGIAPLDIRKEVTPNPDPPLSGLDKALAPPVSQPPAGRSWRDLQPAQQAGIRCSEPMFQHFLKTRDGDDWLDSGQNPAACVRLICGVKSRVELGTQHKARMLWHQLDSQFMAWKLER